MQETPDLPIWTPSRWPKYVLLFAVAFGACLAWRALERREQTTPAFVPPAGDTAACWVRTPSSLQKLAQLGFADGEAWEVGAAQDGWLTITCAVSDADGVEVRVPMEAGSTASVWYRLQLARSGLVDFYDDEDGPRHRSTGEYGWIHPADRWTFTLTVLFSGVPEFTDGVEFADGAVRSLGSRLKVFPRINQDPLPLRLIDGPRASVSVSCTPSGGLAIPADARVAGVTVGLLPWQEQWSAFPDRDDPAFLHETEWATRDATGGNRPVGTWRLGLEFEAVE